MRTGLEGTNHIFEVGRQCLVESKHENPGLLGLEDSSVVTVCLKLYNLSTG